MPNDTLSECKLRLIRLLAEDLEAVRDIFPFETGNAYYLPTPYNAFGVAAILADCLENYGQEAG